MKKKLAPHNHHKRKFNQEQIKMFWRKKQHQQQQQQHWSIARCSFFLLFLCNNLLSLQSLAEDWEHLQGITCSVCDQTSSIHTNVLVTSYNVHAHCVLDFFAPALSLSLSFFVERACVSHSPWCGSYEETTRKKITAFISIS